VNKTQNIQNKKKRHAYCLTNEHLKQYRIMKKIFFLLGLLLTTTLTVNSQEISKNAIGLRFGDNSGLGTEISYQHKLEGINRLEINLGLRDNKIVNSFKATGVYQWVWPLENRFNWYAGIGAGIGSWKEKITNTSETFIFGTGDIGIEYNFEAPLLVSLDFRPEFGLSDVYKGYNTDIALSLRYQF